MSFHAEQGLIHLSCILTPSAQQIRVLVRDVGIEVPPKELRALIDRCSKQT
jgi:hypothetical protein